MSDTVRMFMYQEFAPLTDKDRLVSADERWSQERVDRELESRRLDAVNREDAEVAEHLRQIAKWAKKARVGAWIERIGIDKVIRRCFCISSRGHG